MFISRQAFLPTDTVAPFDSFPDIYLWVAMAGMAIWIVAVVFCARVVFQKVRELGVPDKKIWDHDMILRLRFFTFFTGLSVMILVLGFGAKAYQVHVANTEAVEIAFETNYQNMIENVKSVYAVDDVRSASGQTVSPSNEPNLFVFQDGVAIEVLYREDEETHEPILAVVSSPETEGVELKKR